MRLNTFSNNLLTLSASAFLLVSSTALVFTSNTKTKKVKNEVLGIQKQKLDLPLLPVLKADTFPTLSAQGVLAIDLNSNVVLYEKAADSPLLPASTTKIMTALVAFDTYDLTQIISITSPAVEGQKMDLVKGEKITVESLLQGLLIYSANDAAEVLAQAHPQGRDAFIQKMNEYTQVLHLRHTTFTNPTGLDDPKNVSTARDLVFMSSFALKNDFLSKTVATKSLTVTDTTGKITHQLTNTNELLGEVEGVLGIKTGWTQNARENLVTLVQRENKKVLIAVLGSQDRFGETKQLIDWIFTSYNWEKVPLPQDLYSQI
jgi:D-alanyl-D-alanine carboxypeptidase